MTGQPKDGGPAFPIETAELLGRGMTLRDWFAGQALNAAFSSSWDADLTVDANARVSAVWAYAIADAMIAARGAA